MLGRLRRVADEWRAALSIRGAACRSGDEGEQGRRFELTEETHSPSANAQSEQFTLEAGFYQLQLAATAER